MSSLELDPFSDVASKAKERLAALGTGTPPPIASAAAPPLAPAADLPAAGAEMRDCPGCPVMIVVPPGQFIMGSPPSEPGRDGDEGPPHLVRIAKAFAVGKYEVTFDEWEACVAERACGSVADQGWGRGRRPVINVSYEQAVGYAEWLSDKTRKKYRLCGARGHVVQCQQNALRIPLRSLEFASIKPAKRHRPGLID